jgi:hypothetical protein
MDYNVAFTPERWAKLQEAFPAGVCDYSQPGVSQQPPKARWLSFANGPGGEPLGDAPRSEEITVGTRLAEQIALVGSANGGSFAAELRAVLAAYDRGDLDAACGSLSGYASHVRAHSGKALAKALGDQLLLNAHGIAAAIGCRL